jgi:hypothetical protein
MKAPRLPPVRLPELYLVQVLPRGLRSQRVRKARPLAQQFQLLAPPLRGCSTQLRVLRSWPVRQALKASPMLQERVDAWVLGHTSQPC